MTEAQRNKAIVDIFDPQEVDDWQDVQPEADDWQDIPAPQEQPEPDVLPDIIASAVNRGLPEAAAAATPLGYGLNVVRGVSDLVRAGGRYAIDKTMGIDLEGYAPNPIPTSSDVLNAAVSKLPQSAKQAILATDEGLYEPQTGAGEATNRMVQIGIGGKLGGAPLRSTIPAAVVSEGSGQLAEEAGYDGTLPRVVGAIAGGVAGSKFGNQPKQPIKTSEDVKALAREQYNIAEQRGGVLKPEFTDKFADQLEGMRPQTEVGKLVAGETPITKLVERINEYRGKPISLQGAQEIDEYLGDLIDDFTDVRGVTKQGKKLLDVQTAFRNMVEEVDDASVIGGKEGFQALKEGRKLWSQQAKLRDIEKVVERAERMEQPAQGIKTGFRTLLGNDKRMRGFTAEERELIKKAADTGIPTDIIKSFGSRLIPIITAASGGGFGGTMAATAASTAARNLASKIQVGKADEIARAISNRGVAPVVAQNPLRQLINQPMTPFNGVGIQSAPLQRVAATQGIPAEMKAAAPMASPELPIAPIASKVQPKTDIATPTAKAKAKSAAPQLSTRIPKPDKIMKQFEKIARESKNGDEFVLRARELKNVPPEVSAAWRERYAPNGETLDIAAQRYVDEIKGALPAPLTSAPSQWKEGLSPKAMRELQSPSSYMVRNKETGEVIREINPEAVPNLNTAKYEAVPIAEHLANLNGQTYAKSGLSDSAQKVYNLFRGNAPKPKLSTTITPKDKR